MSISGKSSSMNYAETTMNELLGLYGYDGVSSNETESLNLTKYRSQSKDKKKKTKESPDDDVKEDKEEKDGSDCDSDLSDNESLPDDESVRSRCYEMYTQPFAEVKMAGLLIRRTHAIFWRSLYFKEI
ncbi:hypothetical protein LOTGIDRAFT_154205 [Lottia gigantea]|uniref:Uncharacterized protein n=1 Tax=Lottia gigantea TaxID=225164 RepID=V3ZXJ6_LOTGI|nr:hypothetical protein LOTGIDRAFT_154205 [Lottia gigantea]ESO89122.1 hypothetical protein LOTGIDRAFT_154205 [Lottia gigantea]